MCLAVCSQWLTLEEIKEHQILPSPGPYLPTSQEYKFGSEGESFPFLLKNLDTAEAQVSLSGCQVLLNHTF